jgi:hypothetical protein
MITAVAGDGNGLITASWTLPQGVTAASIQIAHDPAVDASGFFATSSQTDYAALSATQTTYTTDIPQAAGIYYVHIAGVQAATGPLYLWSPATLVTIPARIVPGKKGSSSAVVKAGARTYAANTKTLVRALTSCPTLACSFRQVHAFAVKQLSFDRLVGKDVGLPAPCGSAARALRSRLLKSETATSSLQRAVASGLEAATLKSRARTAGLQAGRAISSADVYVAACG